MKRFLILLSLLSYTTLYGQDDDFTLPTLDDMVTVPPSPEAQAFTKYGNLPVSLYTGSPDVKIPVHTIKGREIELPIFLSYDASGIKVTQLATWIGLGWNLNAGGAVTRQVNGLPDDYLDGSVISQYSIYYNSHIKDKFDQYKNFTPAAGVDYNQSTVDLNEYFLFMDNIKKRKIETQPDSYSFSINGLSGTFYIDYENSVAYCLDQPDIKVIPSFQNGSGGNTSKIITGWEITDKFGTIYRFNNVEATEEYESFGFGENSESTRKYNSAWYVSEIRTKNNRDTINFNYTTPQEWTNKQIAGIGESRRENIDPSCASYGTILPGTKEYKITQFDLTDIVVNGNTEVVLTTSTGLRSDLLGKKALDKIQINNSRGNRRRLIDLNNDTYFGTTSANETTSRLKLTAVDFYGRADGTNPEETYTFDYYSNGTFPSRSSKAQDYWGYYNGQSVNDTRNTLVPYMSEFDDNNPGYSGANREPSLTYAKVGSLKTITYPTGGSTDFHYKLHRREENQFLTQTEVYMAANILFASGGIDPADPYGYNACDDMSLEKPKGKEEGFWVEQSGDVTVTLNVYAPENVVSDGVSYVAFYKTGEGCWITSTSPTGTICDQGAPEAFCTVFNDGTVPFAEYGNFISPTTITKTFHLDSGYYHAIMLNSNEESSLHLTVKAERTTTEHITGVDVGGLRTYKIVDKSDANTIAKTKYIYYNDLSTTPSADINTSLLESTEMTTGMLHLPLYMTDQYRYMNENASCAYLTRHSSSLASSTGPHMTYSKVTELEFANGTFNGLQVHSFHNENKARMFISAPRQVPLNGKLLTRKVYELNGSNLELRQTEVNTYSVSDVLDGLGNPLTTTGFKMHSTADELQYILITPGENQNHFRYKYKNGFFGGFVGPSIKEAKASYQYCTDAEDIALGNHCIPGPVNNGQKLTFGFSSKWIRQENKVLTWTDHLGNDIATTTEYGYGSTDHYQLTEIKSYDSRGTARKTKLYYPHDLSITSMINTNRIGEEVKREYYNGAAKIFTRETSYTQYGFIFVPQQIKISTGNNTPEPRYLINRYDQKGNILEISKDNGISLSDHGTVVSYIWGYDNMYPVAKIENARYPEIETALGSAVLASINGNTLADASIQNHLTTLKSALPNALVTGYTYDPGAGITSVSDPNLGTTYFEYDDYNRLKYTKRYDTSGDIHVMSMNDYDITNKYLRSHNYLSPRTTTLSESASMAQPNSEVSITTQFVDGLGRPTQIIQKQASFNDLDIVQYSIYDGFGRQLVQDLPFTSGNNGGIKTDPETLQDSFYDAHFGGSSGAYAFSESEIEQSPLGRVLKSYAPGQAWSKTGGDKPVTTTYRTNISSDQVRIWEIGVGPDPVTSPPSGEYESANVHGEGTLHVTETTDENGYKSIEFKDKLGRVLLKKVQEGGSNYLSTYYVYDALNNLRYVLPPEAVKAGQANGNAISTSILNDYGFYYEYDDRNRMIVKKVPGAKEVHMVYDKRDRLIMTQDGEQRLAGEWNFTKYDELNRPGITGIFIDDTTNHNRAYHQTRVDAMLILNLAADDEQANTHKEGEIIETNHYDGISTVYRAEQHVALQAGFKYDATGNGPILAEIQNPIPNIEGTWVDIYYDNTYPEINGAEILTVNYYDNYDFTSEVFLSRNSVFATIDNEKPNAHLFVKGQMTGSKTKVLGTQNDFIRTVNFYDDKYQVIQTITINHKGGKEINTSQFDFAGRLRVTYQEHQNPGADVASATVKMTYSYDHAGRLLKVEHRLNGGAAETISEHGYNELGELKTKDLADAHQTVDYKYNMRGWLTKMNDPTIDDDTRFFAMELQYDNAAGSYAQHNGNIGTMLWRNPFDDDHSIYQYQYDALNRLTDANYGIESATTNNDFQVHGITYDSNGNIETLQRKSKGNTIDNLSYLYQGNQLAKVTDASNSDEGFKDGTDQTTEYLYDENGNMKEDKNKGITSITYNYLNLPKKVTFASDKYIEYTYDAAGIKLSQKVVDGSTTKVTDYLGNFIYEDDQLQLIQHEEGRITYDNGTYDYQYHLKDHLGNVRTTFTPTPDPDDTYLATMEIENDATESQYFSNLATAHVNLLANHTLNGNEAALLDNNSPIGPAMSLEVVPGDVIDLEVYGYYEGGSGYSNTAGLSGFVATLASAFGGANGGANGGGSESQSIFDGVNDFIAGLGGLNGTGDDNVPAAYMNYILVNQDYEQVSGGFVQMSGAANFNLELLSLNNIEVTKAGFLYVYVSLESNVSQGVFFDDLKVVHGHSSVVQSDSYYPFGLTYNSYKKAEKKENKWKFHNQTEFVDDLDLDWYHFKYRMHDPALGRFFAVDPLADEYVYNSPYAFAENKLGMGIELEGAELLPFPWLGTMAAFSRATPMTSTTRPVVRPVAETLVKTQAGKPRWNPNASVTENVKNITRTGRNAHTERQAQWEALEGLKPEQSLGKGNRADGLKIEQGMDGVKRGIIRELKPNSKNGRTSGLKQLERYVEGAIEKFPDVQEWLPELELYYSQGVTVPADATIQDQPRQLTTDELQNNIDKVANGELIDYCDQNPDKCG